MFDILVYGSIVRGKDKVNDIDIVIIFNKKGSVNEKLELAEKLKSQLDFLDINVDVKAVDISDFDDNSFIARQAILAEGYSLIDGKFLHERFGFKAFAIFDYSLGNLNYSQKKMFYYALKGRRGQKGLLELKGAEMLGNCIIKVPLVNSEEFKELFKRRNIEYKMEKSITY
jgi:predicted nucleotidyltransferase